jgi:hypothetical protein
MRFILFVEGYTEDKTLPNFLKKWLDPRLTNPIGIRTVRFEGWSELVKDAPLKAKMHQTCQSSPGHKIHVHHLVPLSGKQQGYEVDPVRDLRPVCPNCHLIIHSKKEPFTIKEAREMVER